MGLVLGSGLGGFADAVEHAVELPYAEIPGWPVSTAIGHAGTLVLGELAGVPVDIVSTGPSRDAVIIRRHPFA